MRTRLDLLLLVMALIWGGNYSVVKSALREIPPLGFNTLRLLLASLVFMAALALRRTRPSRRDLLPLVGLGLVGHFIYQIFFISGLARTSVANSALIIGCTPVVVTLLTTLVGHERVTARHWFGAAMSVAGIYLVVGRGAEVSIGSLLGDAMMVVCIVCWAIYTVGSRALLARLSPLEVTGYSMALGTLFYAPVGLPDLQRLDWHAVSAAAWAGVVFSAVFALCVCYLIWYTAVQRIGNTRTAAYSNLVPVFSLLVAAVWLHERIGAPKIAGAAAILLGVAVTRSAAATAAPPPEE